MGMSAGLPSKDEGTPEPPKSFEFDEPIEFFGKPEGISTPGLDDALEELGIYVGSVVLRKAAERAGIAARSDLPVLLLGETGTGKERFAHLIHRLSPRSQREIVAIYHNWQTAPSGGWAGEFALGGSAKRITVGQNLNYTLEIFYIGTDDH